MIENSPTVINKKEQSSKKAITQCWKYVLSRIWYRVTPRISRRQIVIRLWIKFCVNKSLNLIPISVTYSSINYILYWILELLPQGANFSRRIQRNWQSKEKLSSEGVNTEMLRINSFSNCKRNICRYIFFINYSSWKYRILL